MMAKESEFENLFVKGKIESERLLWKFNTIFKDEMEIVSLIPTMIIGTHLSKRYN